MARDKKAVRAARRGRKVTVISDEQVVDTDSPVTPPSRESDKGSGTMGVLAIIAAIGIAILLVVRDADAGGAPQTCEIDTDCPLGYVCLNGLCVREGGGGGDPFNTENLEVAFI